VPIEPIKIKPELEKKVIIPIVKTVVEVKKPIETTKIIPTNEVKKPMLSE
jgi:hypothetical protein